MDSFNKFLQNKLDKAVLPNSPYLASYVLVNRVELEHFLSQKWPLFNVARSGEHREFTVPAKSRAAIANLEKSISRTHAKLIRGSGKRQRQDVLELQFLAEYSHDTEFHSCRICFKLADNKQLERQKNDYDNGGSDDRSSHHYALPTVAIVTAALLHGGLLTRVKLNELHELFDEKSRFNVLIDEQKIYEKILEMSSFNLSILSLISKMIKYSFQLLDSLKTFKLIDFTGVKLDLKIIVKYINKINKRCLEEDFKIIKLWITLVQGDYRATAVRRASSSDINIVIPKEILTTNVQKELNNSLWNQEYVRLQVCIETIFYLGIIKATLVDVIKPIDKL